MPVEAVSGQLPLDSCSPDNSHLRHLFPEQLPPEQFPSRTTAPEQLPLEQLPPIFLEGEIVLEPLFTL